MNSIFKILIFDRYPVFGKGLKLIIENEKELFVLKVLDDPKDTILQMDVLRPDLLIFSSVPMNMDDIPYLRKIRLHHPGLPILVITGKDPAFLMDELVGLKVEGIVNCALSPEKFIEAIFIVLNGKTFYPEEIRGKKSLTVSKNVSGHPQTGKSVPNLSKREMEILRKLSEGLTHKEIAQQLFISHRTVETHRNKILTKLNLHTTADIIKFGFQLDAI